MEDVLDVYQRPYDSKRPVVCLDEGGKELRETPAGTLPITQSAQQIALMQPKRPATPDQPEQAAVPEREDYEYERHGKANLFLSVEPLAGRRRVRVTERHTGCDFAEEVRRIVEEDYPDAETLVLVTDNLNTHKPASLYERFAPEVARRMARRIEWHYTPEHGSWLNIAELELSVLQRQCLDRRIADADTLAREVAAWEAERNSRSVTVDWHFTTEDARIKLKRLYPILKEQNTT